jgi:hypothetical protein
MVTTRLVDQAHKCNRGRSETEKKIISPLGRHHINYEQEEKNLAIEVSTQLYIISAMTANDPQKHNF